MEIIKTKMNNEVEKFLNSYDITPEKCDETYVALEDGKIVGTISRTKNIIKMFAVCKNAKNDMVGPTLLNTIEADINESFDSIFVFSKTELANTFARNGYKELASFEGVSVYEKGFHTIEDYVEELNLSDQHGAIVMNANPFTLGHKYLVEKALEKCEKLIVFVVEENSSAFDFNTRFELVKNGLKEFKNVKVVPSGKYIISSITFPSYFIKKGQNVANIQQNLDAIIFGKHFSKIGINKRFIGTEPISVRTNIYNKALKEQLPKFGIEVIEFSRVELAGNVVSATTVRKLLKERNFEEIKKLVPQTTYEFLVSEKCEPIIERLNNEKDSRH